MNIDTTQSKPFDHAQNIVVGLARVIYGTYGYSWEQKAGWFIPGGRFTQDREDAHACAVEINRLLGGVQITN